MVCGSGLGELNDSSSLCLLLSLCLHPRLACPPLPHNCTPLMQIAAAWNLRVVLLVNQQYMAKMGVYGCAMTSWSAVIGGWAWRWQGNCLCCPHVGEETQLHTSALRSHFPTSVRLQAATLRRRGGSAASAAASAATRTARTCGVSGVLRGLLPLRVTRCLPARLAPVTGS